MMSDEEAEDPAVESSENDFLRIRLEMMQYALPDVAAHMWGVLSHFMEAGFSSEHAFDFAKSTYERVLADFGL